MPITRIIQTLQECCIQISKLVNNTNSFELSATTTNTNQSNETIKQLDNCSNDILVKALRNLPEIRKIGSEEETELLTVNPRGKYLVCFDPLDGSSNIGVNITIGTIFAIYEYYSYDTEITSGNQIVAGGYCLYGGSTQLVLATREDGVSIYQLQEDYVFEEIVSNYYMPRKGKIVSHNQSNLPLYLDPRISLWFRELIDNLRYSFRYVGSLVADAHRTLVTGGVFLYPANQTNPDGKIRLLYEAYPIAFIFECAGGMATNGDINILQIQFPTKPHQRTPIYLSSQEEYIFFSSI